MATETTISRVFRARLDNGTTESGTVRTINQSMGTLGEISSWDATKAYAIGAALAPCLTKSIYALQNVETKNITSGS